MNEMLKSDGGNDFKIPDVRKQAKRRAGKGIVGIDTDTHTISKARDFISRHVV